MPFAAVRGNARRFFSWDAVKGQVRCKQEIDAVRLCLPAADDAQRAGMAGRLTSRIPSWRPVTAKRRRTGYAIIRQ